MKNQVNFYQPSLKPKSESFNLTQVLLSYAVALVLITGWSVYNGAELEQWLTVEKTERTKLESARKKLQKISANLGTQPDKRLVQQAERLQREIQAKEYLLGRLRNEQETGRGTYAQLMLALARHHQPEIWLTHIGVSGSRLQLEGKSLSAEAVPRWLERLSKSDYFIGTEFGSLKVFRDDQDQLNFVLGATELPSAKTVGGSP